MTKQDRLAGCIIGGAIGDAWGSSSEGLAPANPLTFYWGKPEKTIPKWAITDDTQLTLITLEALLNSEKVLPELLAADFLSYYKRGLLTGLGASTLKALRELAVGSHWSLAGRAGEYAAGNGAAMRIAPFAFWNNYSREEIREFCRITHRNDEAYVGALAVVLALKEIVDNGWDGRGYLIEAIIPHLPDTKVRDRLIDINSLSTDASIAEAAKLGASGYVVDSVPFAIFCGSKVRQLGMANIIESIIEAGGDTDTNASIAGQIAGAFLGVEEIPRELSSKLSYLNGFDWLARVLNSAKLHFK